MATQWPDPAAPASAATPKAVSHRAAARGDGASGVDLDLSLEHRLLRADEADAHPPGPRRERSQRGGRDVVITCLELERVEPVARRVIGTVQLDGGRAHLRLRLRALDGDKQGAVAVLQVELVGGAPLPRDALGVVALAGLVVVAAHEIGVRGEDIEERDGVHDDRQAEEEANDGEEAQRARVRWHAGWRARRRQGGGRGVHAGHGSSRCGCGVGGAGVWAAVAVFSALTMPGPSMGAVPRPTSSSPSTKTKST
jgi:hypothetical protein